MELLPDLDCSVMLMLNGLAYKQLKLNPTRHETIMTFFTATDRRSVIAVQIGNARGIVESSNWLSLLATVSSPLNWAKSGTLAVAFEQRCCLEQAQHVSRAIQFDQILFKKSRFVEATGESGQFPWVNIGDVRLEPVNANANCDRPKDGVGSMDASSRSRHESIGERQSYFGMETFVRTAGKDDRTASEDGDRLDRG
jgi:hypothetical protein